MSRFRTPRISDAVIRRLVLYMRILDDIEDKDEEMAISSYELGELAGVRAAQVRKDLAWFGEFGKQGVGYKIGFLRMQLHDILHFHRPVSVAIVGLGHLGMALARYNMDRYNEEEKYYLKVSALFDKDPRKIGLFLCGIKILHVDEIQTIVKEKDIEMRVITVPRQGAQEVAYMLLDAGVKNILNFAPTTISVPDDVKLHNADISLELQHLAYYLGRDKATP